MIAKRAILAEAEMKDEGERKKVRKLRMVNSQDVIPPADHARLMSYCFLLLSVVH